MTLQILLLCNKPSVGKNANTVIDHIEALEQYSSSKVWVCSILGDLPRGLDLDRFDAVIIHYSSNIMSNRYLSQQAKAQLRAYSGLKVVFLQDEYRQINRVKAQLAFLQADILFTCFATTGGRDLDIRGRSEAEKIYDGLPNLQLHNTLTGYIPARLLEQQNLPTTSERPLHVGYRGRKSPFWYGELGYEKWNIVDKWQQIVTHPSLKTNLSYQESDRIYGEAWQEFLSSCKATLGVESGTSVMDFTGELESQVERHCLKHPKDDFYKVQQQYFKQQEGLYALNQISPRCFEAIALKTVLVLYEGDYSGILIPHRHYIPLKKDFSNQAEVVARLLDDAYLQAMADRAYKEIALNPAYGYPHFVAGVDRVIQEACAKRSKASLPPYTAETFAYLQQQPSLKTRLYPLLGSLYAALPHRLKLLVRSALTTSSQSERL